MTRIDIKNRGKKAVEKELAIKKTLISSPKKITIQYPIGRSFSVYPFPGTINDITLDPNWYYSTTSRYASLFSREPHNRYTIRFCFGPTHVDDVGKTITSQDRLELELGDILEYRFLSIILDYSDGDFNKKIYMTGKIFGSELEITNAQIINKLEFYANEEDIAIKIEEKSA